jgi:1-phosphofructokinase family hexose kinase
MLITLGATPAVQKTLVFDRLTLDDVNRTADVSSYASGKSINAARVLHTLGKPVTALGFAGGDSGAFLRSDLDGAGIPTDLVEVPPATRTATTLIDRAAGTATELIEESLPVDRDYFETLLERLQLHLNGARFVLLCGSLPPGAPVDFYARCVAACRRGSVPVLLDATGEPLRQALAERPTVVKPNRRELAQTVGFAVDSELDLRRAITELLARGPHRVVVTAGGGPSIASDGTTFWSIPTPSVQVVSAIGSGDAFAAGLAAGLADRHSFPDACRLAAACGAANAMTARAGEIDPQAVARLLHTPR